MDPIGIDIDLINKFDFTKGFRRFHIVWPLKKILKPLDSPAFETTVGNGDRKVSLVWNLSVDADQENPANTWFGLCLQTNGKIPVVCRISMASCTTEKPILNASFFHMLSDDLDYGCVKSLEKMATIPEGEMVFQCWLDIPNMVVVESNNRKRKHEASEDMSWDTSTLSEFSQQNVALFHVDMARLFSSVVNGEDGYGDITLAVSKEGQVVRRFLCHRGILSTRSTVFERLFARKEWKENAENGERLIEIEDVDEPTMEMILNHVYTSYLPDMSATIDQLSGLIYAADKYNLSSLKNWCVLLLIGGHDEDWERIQQLQLADRHNLDQLKAICISQLSMDIALWQTEAGRDRIPSHLLSEILAAMNERQYGTEEIVLASG